MWDKGSNKPATSLSEVPANVSRVIPQRLSAALCARMCDAKVESVEVFRAAVNPESFDVR